MIAMYNVCVTGDAEAGTLHSAALPRVGLRLVMTGGKMVKNGGGALKLVVDRKPLIVGADIRRNAEGYFFQGIVLVQAGQRFSDEVAERAAENGIGRPVLVVIDA